MTRPVPERTERKALPRLHERPIVMIAALTIIASTLAAFFSGPSVPGYVAFCILTLLLAWYAVVMDMSRLAAEAERGALAATYEELSSDYCIRLAERDALRRELARLAVCAPPQVAEEARQSLQILGLEPIEEDQDELRQGPAA